ncbi:MAG: hypothetical protein GF404_04860 [candidate division Zixibacteria bacterium]|nr:hypothetical protein [candidate division Zixibacteria bacterium]
MGKNLPEQVSALYTDIGRGHPNYLDSVLRMLRPKLEDTPEKLAVTSVFKESHGFSRMAWKMVARMYRAGGRGGLVSRFYNNLRKNRKSSVQSGMIVKYLGRDLRRKYTGYDGVVLVAHPLLAQLLSDICRVWYVHGEIAWPVEFDLMRTEKIFVPLEITQDRMLAAGLMSAQFEITGLVLEPEIASKNNELRENRSRRIEAGREPTFAFFTSGAYPRYHQEQIISAIGHILTGRLGRVILSAGCDHRMVNWMKGKLAEFNPEADIEKFNRNESKLIVFGLPERENLTLLELSLLETADIIIMAAHERINWTVGLGFPTILLTPDFGSFAPLNREFAREHGLLYDISNDDIRSGLDRFVQDYRARSKRLIFETTKFGLEGASRISDIIVKELN